MKQKIILAVVVAAVVLAAAFALHRPQAGTQPTPEPTRQAETNDAVPAEPTPQPHQTFFRLIPNTPRWRIRLCLRFRLAVPMISPFTLARY